MGQYRIVRRVAIGPVAEVFLGAAVLAEGIESPIAVKRLLPMRAADPRVVRRFAHRASRVLPIADPTLVKILDAGISGEGHFLVLEWVDGVALGALQLGAAFRGVRLGAAEALYVVERIAAGLTALHETPGRDALFHRDLSPAAVLISRRGDVRLSGLVTGRIAAMDGLDCNPLGRGYLAPEAIAHKRVGPLSDLFSLGVILWELLSGRRLFGGGAIPRLRNFDPVRLPALPGIPPPALDLARRLLAPEPSARFPSARAALLALGELRASTGLAAGPAELAEVLSRALPALPPARDTPDQLAGELLVKPYPAQLRPDRDEPPAVSAKPVRPRWRLLGEILVERGQARPGEIDAALEIQRTRGGKLGEILRERGVVSEMDLVRAASLQAGVPFVSDEKLDAMPVPQDLVGRLPPPVAERHRLVPLAFRDKTLFVAALDPRDERALAEVQRVTGVPAVQGVFATGAAIDRALVRFYRSVGLTDPAHTATGLSLRLLGAATTSMDGAARMGPALADLARRLARELGGSAAEVDAAAAGAYALALAARIEGQTRFTRPGRRGLEGLLGTELGDATPLLLASARELVPSGTAAEALSAAAALVEVADSASPAPEVAVGALETLRSDSGATARAVAALARLLVPAAEKSVQA